MVVFCTLDTLGFGGQVQNIRLGNIQLLEVCKILRALLGRSFRLRRLDNYLLKGRERFLVYTSTYNMQSRNKLSVS